MSDWTSCYSEGWGTEIHPEAYQHPAKYSRNLIRRIYEHAIERDWLHPGDVVLDCFGGVALGSLDAMWNGCLWVGCELEERFVTLGRQNIERFTRRYGNKEGWGSAVLLHGDSRQLASHVTEASLIISSPPYGGNTNSDYLLSEDGKTRQREVKRGYKQGHGCFRGSETYGQSPGQLGVLKEGDLDAVIASPPYVDSVNSQQHGIDWSKVGPATGNRKRGEGTKHEATLRAQLSYGSEPGQLGAMKEGAFDAVVSSPPYGEMLNQSGGGIYKTGEYTDTKGGQELTYGISHGQIGAAKEGNFDAVVSSPPYEGIRQDGGRIAAEGKGGFGPYTNEPAVYWHTQRDQNNLGNLKTGDTFWAASRTILEQCYLLLKPGGVAIFVTKDFVRDKQRVPFSDQWQQLCESVGFRFICRHRALLVESYGEQDGLFGGVTKVERSKKSFFRRLAEKKGSPRIDHEDVICLRKPKEM